MNNTSKGFVALISIILISTVLSVVIIETSTHAFVVQSYIQENSNKVQSYYNALSCMDVAKNNLHMNPAYTGNEEITIGSYVCTIFSIDTANSRVTLTTQSKVHTSQTTLIESI